MSPILIAPPLAEPVSLAETKLYLKIDVPDEDDLVRTLISAARLLIEAASGRLLIHQTWRLVLDHWPQHGEIRLPLAPVAQVVAARVFDAAGIPQALAPTALELVAGTDPPLMVMATPVPPPGRPRAGIEIDLLAGFGPAAVSVPHALRQAILMLVARWFELRGDVASRGDARLPADVLALLAPFRRARL